MSSTVTVPYWPHVSATVRADATGELTINGTSHPITAATVDDARQMILATVHDKVVTTLKRAVRVDTTDPDGQQWQLIVYPDETIEDATITGGHRTARRPAPQPRTPAQDSTSQQTPKPPTPPAAPTAPAAPAPPAAPVPPAAWTLNTARTPGASVQHGTQKTTTAPSTTAAGSPGPAVPPTLQDLLAYRPAPPPGPAKAGWRGAVRLLSAGLIAPQPGAQEMNRRNAVAAVQRSLRGPKTVVVLNPKGGAYKTTDTLLIARTFGIHRGGYTLAWDNNETRGTLGWRANQARHQNTAVDLLRDLHRFTDVRSARVGDLDNYVRSQGDAQFDVLASDEDAASAASIDAQAFTALHRTLSRFYRVMIIDTGNNMRASNWRAAVEVADQLVIACTIREDTAQSAAWLIDALRATGNSRLVEQAVTVLAAPAASIDQDMRARLHAHFGQLTRAVLDVPHDPSLVGGGPISYDALTTASRNAWLHVTAAITDGL